MATPNFTLSKDTNNNIVITNTSGGVIYYTVKTIDTDGLTVKQFGSYPIGATPSAAFTLTTSEAITYSIANTVAITLPLISDGVYIFVTSDTTAIPALPSQHYYFLYDANLKSCTATLLNKFLCTIDTCDNIEICKRSIKYQQILMIQHMLYSVWNYNIYNVQSISQQMGTLPNANTVNTNTWLKQLELLCDDCTSNPTSNALNSDCGCN